MYLYIHASPHFYLRFAFSLLTPALTGLRDTVRCESRPTVEMLGFSQLKKGHFNGMVDEGNSLRQKLAFRAEFAKNTKLAEKLR